MVRLEYNSYRSLVVRMAYRVSNLVIGLKSGIGPVSLFFPNHLQTPKVAAETQFPQRNSQTLTTFKDAKSPYRSLSAVMLLMLGGREPASPRFVRFLAREPKS